MHQLESAKLRTHRKENSTDSVQSYRRKRFLSVVSSESLAIRPAHLRKVSELARPGLDLTNELGRTGGKEEGKNVARKIKRASAQIQRVVKQQTKEGSQPCEKAMRGVGERMQLFKKRLTNLTDLAVSTFSKENQKTEDSARPKPALQTPINRLLFESAFRQSLR